MADANATLDQVQKMIADAIQAHVAEAHTATAIDLVPGLSTPGVPQAPIDAKLLKGLKFRTSKPRKGGAGDDDATVHDRVERDLTPADVLGWRDLGDKVTFTTADGQRYTVDKKASKAAATDADQK